jgi:hypothetical protein
LRRKRALAPGCAADGALLVRFLLQSICKNQDKRAAMISIEAEPGSVSIDPQRTALVIIDMQRDFLEPGGFGDRSATTSASSARRWRRARRCWPVRASTACW